MKIRSRIKIRKGHRRVVVEDRELDEQVFRRVLEMAINHPEDSSDVIRVTHEGADFWLKRDGAGMVLFQTKTAPEGLMARGVPTVNVEPRTSLSRAVTGLAAGLLPRSQRRRYLEEWRAEIADSIAEGECWYHRAAYSIRVLLRSPMLSVTLLLRRRATE